MMGTDLQDVFDSFFVKIPSVDFTGKESQVIQLMKSAIGRCYRQTYDDLTYTYDTTSKTGSFVNIITQSSIELVVLNMVKEYFSQKFAVLSNRKQYLGTQAFDKIPSNKEEFNTTKQSIDFWNGELEKLISELPDYSDER
jgi:hypothetical protein